MQTAILNDVTLTADCIVIWGNLTTGARPRCREMSGHENKLTCDRGIIGIIGVIGNIDRNEEQTCSHYCSRTVLVCPKERGWKLQITTPIN